MVTTSLEGLQETSSSCKVNPSRQEHLQDVYTSLLLKLKVRYILVAAGSVDTQMLTASVVLSTLVLVLAGGAEAEGVSGLVEGVAGEAGADYPPKVS